MELVVCNNCPVCIRHDAVCRHLDAVDRVYLDLAQSVTVTEDASWLTYMDDLCSQRAESRTNLLERLTSEWCQQLSIVIQEAA